MEAPKESITDAGDSIPPQCQVGQQASHDDDEDLLKNCNKLESQALLSLLRPV